MVQIIESSLEVNDESHDVLDIIIEDKNLWYNVRPLSIILKIENYFNTHPMTQEIITNLFL